MTKPVTPQEMFDLWQKMVNPSAYPLQSLMFPVLDPKELEKKIADLETVEHWLKANLGMLQLTIRSLQYQRAMLKGGEKAMEVLGEKGGPAKAKTKGEELNPAMWAWNMMVEAGKSGADAASALTPEAARPVAKKKKRKTGVPPARE